MWWILAREVLRLRGTISREVPWTVMPDLYFYRDPEEAEKEEQEKAKEAASAAAPPPPQAEEWNQTDQYQPVVEDWAEPNATLPPPAAVPVPVAVAAEIPAAPMVVDEWGAQTAQDWAGEAPKATPAAEWEAESPNPGTRTTKEIADYRIERRFPNCHRRQFSFFHRRFILKEFLKENPTENSTTTSFSLSKRIFVLKFFSSLL